LVRVTVALWEEKGYDSTTVEDIASAAGVSWSTFYFHFPRKESLLHELALALLRVWPTTCSRFRPAPP
jgi:NADH dehydrogenase